MSTHFKKALEGCMKIQAFQNQFFRVEGRTLAKIYYVLAQSWSPSLKHDEKFKDVLIPTCTKWTLHNLYLHVLAEDNSRIELTRIDKDFSKAHPYEDVEVPHLDEVSPRVSRKKNHSIYKLRKFAHEKHNLEIIRMHESCPEMFPVKILNSKQYFSQQVKLFGEHNMNDYLPCEIATGAEMTEQTFEDRIDVGKRTHLKFITNEMDEMKYLNEVYLYFDLSFNLIDCPVDFQHDDKLAIFEECPTNCEDVPAALEAKDKPVFDTKSRDSESSNKIEDKECI